ncbi:hypothetical protein [Pseudomonas folii]|uniref:Uncharacterized protein n=1 Tax=Pseudomonas folii TaxID=2762593 RepID=A0ABR7B7R6_9PSED|nr:hypothetical protein [Pseudomonas folii]MBC3953212.1 hypothetical protein [Pseudomonas folii]
MTVTWNDIETFTVESATGNNRLYRNGRQSLKVRVAIKVIDINSRPVKLTENERLSLTLINTHGGGELKYRSLETDRPLDPKDGEWDWSIANIGQYEYFPTARAQTLALSSDVPMPMSSDTAYIHFYVRSISQIPMTIGVRITRDDGTVFTSVNKTDGKLVVTPVSLPTYQPSHYRFDIIHTMKLGVGALDYIPIELVDNGLNIEFRQIEVKPVGVAHWAGGDKVRVGMVSGYTQPGSLTIVFPDLKGTVAPRVVTGITARKGQPAIISFRQRNLVPEKVSLATITAIDMFGNSHPLRIKIVSPDRVDGRLELY